MDVNSIFPLATYDHLVGLVPYRSALLDGLQEKALHDLVPHIWVIRFTQLGYKVHIDGKVVLTA